MQYFEISFTMGENPHPRLFHELTKATLAMARAVESMGGELRLAIQTDEDCHIDHAGELKEWKEDMDAFGIHPGLMPGATS